MSRFRPDRVPYKVKLALLAILVTVVRLGIIAYVVWMIWLVATDGFEGWI